MSATSGPTNPHTPNIIKAAMIASLVIYCAIIFLVLRDHAAAYSFDRLLNDPLALILTGLAVSMIGTGSIIGGLLRKGIQPQRDASGHEVLTLEQQSRFLSAMLIELACYETIGILGLVLAFLEQAPVIILPFAALSLVLMAKTAATPILE
jgi:F0F1-type ATP synthase membrane subunit c/vacuolar-type H+-ATPase subunit K